MGSVESDYSKLLTKVLFRKMRPQRILIYALAGFMFFADQLDFLMKGTEYLIIEKDYMKYTFILLVVTLAFNCFNILGRDIFSNLQFVPNTRKIRHTALFINQFLLILIGQILGIGCYLLTCLTQNIHNVFRSGKYVYRAVPVEALVIVKGFLFYLLLGTTLIIGLLLFRYLMCHYNKILITIFGLISLNLLWVLLAMRNDHVVDPVLVVFGQYMLGAQKYWIMMTKLFVICLIMAASLIFLIKGKAKPNKSFKVLYLVEYGLLVICLTLFAGSANAIISSDYSYTKSEWYRKKPGVDKETKSYKLGDASKYGSKLNLNMKGVAADSNVILKKYKANEEGNNPITIEMNQDSTIDVTGVCNLTNTKLVKGRGRKDTINLEMKYDTIVLTGMTPYFYLNRYLQGKYLYNTMVHFSKLEIILSYPDTMDVGDIAIRVNNADYTLDYYDYDTYKKEQKY